MGRRVFGAGEPVVTVDDDSVARSFAGAGARRAAPAPSPIVPEALINAAIAQHEAQADPHPQYTTEAEAIAIAEAAAAAVSSPVQSVAGKIGTVTLVKADVGLDAVDNTADADKPVSTATATALSGKEAAGTAAGLVSAHTGAADPHPQYTTAAEAAAAAPVQSVAGKTGAVTLVKADVGLGAVDNTADADKPISTPTATALSGKEAAGTAAALVTAHESAPDPHPDYVTVAELATLSPRDHYTTHIVQGIL